MNATLLPLLCPVPWLDPPAWELRLGLDVGLVVLVTGVGISTHFRRHGIRPIECWAMIAVGSASALLSALGLTFC